MQHRRIAATAALLADPARAAMVLALMDGRSRTAKKLALDAGITPQTASAHLAKLVAAGILTRATRGKFRDFQIAGSGVAQAVEALSALEHLPVPAAARELRFARCCYDHLAGVLGVRITEELMRPGSTALADLGIVVEDSRRAPYRCCADWTERRPHIAGALGAALLRHYLDNRWLLRVEESRKLVVTHRGREMLQRMFGIEHAFFPA